MTNQHTSLRRALLLSMLVGLLMEGPARAGDGVRLLKQPTVFPLVISAAGSYRLKSNITVPDANTTAIQVTADDVTLDLNGFRISGPTVCSGGPLTCGPIGSGVGIFAASENVTVRNGSVRGMGSHGVVVTSGRVDGVTATNNGADGILAGDTIVTGCITRDNGVQGVTGSHFVVTNSIVLGNGQGGISGNGVVIGNVAYANGQGEAIGAGIVGNGVAIANLVKSNFSGGIIVNGTVVNNVAIGNGGPGIASGDGLVSGNTALINSGAGIEFSFASTGAAIGNASVANGGLGLDLAPGNAYGTNAVVDNTAGTVSGGVEMGTNVCDGSTTCP